MNFKSIVLCEKLFKMFYLYEMITYLKKTTPTESTRRLSDLINKAALQDTKSVFFFKVVFIYTNNALT